ncbi:MAG: permease [bacterium]|nr:permease [Alphaproteobacteria bacterium]MDI1365133.1 permease [bacterium]
MSLHLTAASAGLLAFCITTEIGRELSFKAASDGADGKSAYLAALALQPVLWLGILFWFVEMIAWLLVLEHTPLGLAFPIMTLTYAGVPLAGTLILKERLAPLQIVGAALVAAGVTCVGLSGL